MKNGYYLFAYIEINQIANFYHIDTKRHDQNISLWKYTDGTLALVRYWEIERLSRIKHHNKAFFSEKQALKFIDELLKEFDLTRDNIVEIVGINSIDACYKNEDYNYHSLCHLFSCLLMDSEKFNNSDVLAFSVDLDSDYIIESKSTHGTLVKKLMNDGFSFDIFDKIVFTNYEETDFEALKGLQKAHKSCYIYNPEMDNRLEHYECTSENYFACKKPYVELPIDCYGNVYICTYDWDKRFSLGSINEHSLEYFLKLPNYQEILISNIKHFVHGDICGLCKNCPRPFTR